METDNNKFKTVDQYIAAQPESSQKVLQSIRKIITDAAPTSEEIISYGMPAMKQNGILVFYAVWKNHVGFYPSGSGIEEFKAELSKYKTSKGAIQFPLDEELPSDLIKKIVNFRLNENQKKAEIKAIAKSKK